MRKNHKTAFSLIELSIVLVVISIVIAGALSASTVSLNNAKIKNTTDRMDAIYKALGNFVATNYRLPCPASLIIARDSVGYGDSVGSAGGCSAAGVYKSSAQNAIIYGMIPIAALGLPKELAEDGFGNKLIYVVNKSLTAADYPSTTLGGYFSSFLESDAAAIRILQVPTSNVIDGNAFALISLGQNKYGAFNATLTAQSDTTSTDTYEQKHYPTSVNMATTPYTADYGLVSGFTTRVTFIASNPSSDVFDDIVFYKTRSQMVIDFNAMFLIPCVGDSNYTTAYYGQTSYYKVAGVNSFCTSPSTVLRSKKCAAYGVWTTQQTCFTN
ncbi:MAG: prepilin-type N-terminal cleavage/methylation domain-containing protein [Rickettsiales bacterium]|nr:prepilin-type N-terminal cleavage/methylation domain-containing protein [Rickettsiales bacterium]